MIPANTLFEGSPELTYGEIVAMSGDLYGSFEHLASPYYIARGNREVRTGVESIDAMSRQAKIEEINSLKRLLRLETQLVGEHQAKAERAGESPFGEESIPEGLDTGYVTDPGTGQEIPGYEITTGGRYGELALENFKHFSFGGENVNAWKEGHRTALKEAFTAGLRNDARALMFAIARNAAANHYLTDAFSSGHMRVPRRCADQYYRSLMVGMVDELARRFIDALPEEIDITVPLSALEYLPPISSLPIDIPDIDVEIPLPLRDWARDIVTPLADELRPLMNEPVGQAVGGLVSKWLHDKDNERGLWVTNRAGGTWKAFGDAFLGAADTSGRANTTNREEAQTAVRTDLQEVRDMFQAGKDASREQEQPARPVSPVVFFGFDKPRAATDLSVLAPAARASLDALVTYMNSVEGVSVRLEGWADSRGDEKYNVGLSERRIEVVATYLMQRGMRPDGIAAKQPHGEPVVPTTAANHREYRRVEVVLTGTPRRPGEGDAGAEEAGTIEPPDGVEGPYAAEEYLPEVLEENPPMDPYEWCEIQDASLKSEVSQLAREMVSGLLTGKATTLIHEKLDNYGPYEIEIPVPLADPIRVELPQIPLRRWATELVGPAIERAVEDVVTDNVFGGLLDGACGLAASTPEVESAAQCDDRAASE